MPTWSHHQTNFGPGKRQGISLVERNCQVPHIYTYPLYDTYSFLHVSVIVYFCFLRVFINGKCCVRNKCVREKLMLNSINVSTVSKTMNRSSKPLWEGSVTGEYGFLVSALPHDFAGSLIYISLANIYLFWLWCYSVYFHMSAVFPSN